MAHKEQAEDATRQHNTKSRSDAINDCFAEMFKLDQQIATLVEIHIKPLRDHKNDIRASLREGYEIPSKVISARYAAYKVERTAEIEGDDATMDIIREMWDAIPVGGSVDLVDAAQRAEARANGAHAGA